MLQRRKIFFIIPVFFFLLFINSCKNPDSSKSKATKLATIYKDKLTVVKIGLDLKTARLNRRADKDTLLSYAEHQKDRYAFLKLMVETNYYNLELKGSAPEGSSNKNYNYYIAMVDSSFDYRKKKIRQFCDEDILHLSVEFSKNWPASRIPKTTHQYADYLFYKSELIKYLLQNRCY